MDHSVTLGLQCFEQWALPHRKVIYLQSRACSQPESAGRLASPGQNQHTKPTVCQGDKLGSDLPLRTEKLIAVNRPTLTWGSGKIATLQICHAWLSLSILLVVFYKE